MINQLKSHLLTIVFIIYSSLCFAQEFSDQVKEYIKINDSEFAITNVSIIDGTGNKILYNQDILIKDRKIISINETEKKTLPKDILLIDGNGKTIIPGLIMLHEHLFYAKPFEGEFKAVHMPYTFPKMYLAGGVTTMRTAGSIEANADLNIKNLIEAGKMLGPAIDVSSPHVERTAFIPQIQSLYGDENIDDWIAYWANKGVTSIKVYNNITKQDLKEIIESAHKRNIKVTGHLCSITYEEAIEIGIDNLEHSFMAATDFVEDKPEDSCVNGNNSLLNLDIENSKLNSLINSLIEKNVTLTYTPTVFEPYTGREVIPGGGEQSLAPYLLDQMQNIYDSRANTTRDSISNISFQKEMKRVKKFYDQGGLLTVGTDPTGAGKTIAGYSNQRMIELLIETGFTIEEAIKISTLNGAVYLEVENEKGTIEVGKNADLILINGNLEKDPSLIRKMEIVFKNGIGFDSNKIFESVKGKVGAY